MTLEPYVQLANYRNGLGIKDYWGDATTQTAADVGPFNKGDRVWNTNPTATGTLLWVCTTAGPDCGTAVFTAVTIP